MRLLLMECTVETCYGPWKGSLPIHWPVNRKEWKDVLEIGFEMMNQAVGKIDLGDIPIIATRFRLLDLDNKAYQQFVLEANMERGLFVGNLNMTFTPLLLKKGRR